MITKGISRGKSFVNFTNKIIPLFQKAIRILPSDRLNSFYEDLFHELLKRFSIDPNDIFKGIFTNN